MSATLDDVRSMASKIFRTKQATDAFVDLPCKPLGGIPRRLVEAGKGDEVLAFLEQLADVAPAPPPGMFLRRWLGRR